MRLKSSESEYELTPTELWECATHVIFPRVIQKTALILAGKPTRKPKRLLGILSDGMTELLQYQLTKTGQLRIAGHTFSRSATERILDWAFKNG